MKPSQEYQNGINQIKSDMVIDMIEIMTKGKVEEINIPCDYQDMANGYSCTTIKLVSGNQIIVDAYEHGTRVDDCRLEDAPFYNVEDVLTLYNVVENYADQVVMMDAIIRMIKSNLSSKFEKENLPYYTQTFCGAFKRDEKGDIVIPSYFLDNYIEIMDDLKDRLEGDYNAFVAWMKWKDYHLFDGVSLDDRIEEFYDSYTLKESQNQPFDEFAVWHFAKRHKIESCDMKLLNEEKIIEKYKEEYYVAPLGYIFKKN